MRSRTSPGRAIGWASLAATVAALACTTPGCRSAPGARAASPAAARDSSGFRDRTRESGLEAFRRVDGGSGRKLFVEQMGSGCAIFDYDGDGWQDVYFCSGAALPGYQGPPGSNRLFRNRADGSFEDVTARAGVGSGRYCIGAAVADYDNDGRPDLYLTCMGPNVLYRNNGDGTFTDVTRTAGVGDPRLSSSAAWGDFDRDGFLDLYVANYARWELARDRWCSKFAGEKSFCGPTMYEPEEHTLYRNSGDGTFTDVSKSAGIRRRREYGLGVVWLDFDEDGRQDIFVADDQSPNLLWHNNGDGTFTDQAMEWGVAFGEEGNARAGMGVDAGDFDNDGREDLVITNFTEESNSLYRHEGSMFRDVAISSGMGPATLRYLGFGTAFLDFDRDGWQDLFFANGHVLDDIERYSASFTWAEPAQLFRNRGDGRFEDVSVASGVGRGERVARGSATGDLDNDGRADLVVSVMRGEPLYLHNEAAPAAHWIGLDLRTEKGNRYAVGATAWVRAGGVVQRQDVRINRSYASSSDPRLLFGLGSRARIDEIRVRWPSGATTTIQQPEVDRYHRINESAGSSSQYVPDSRRR